VCQPRTRTVRAATKVGGTLRVPAPHADCAGYKKGPMRVVRWILLLLYVGLVGGLFTMAVLGDDIWPGVLVLGITIAALAMFVLGAGTKNLCRPIRRRRLWLPVAVASFMLAVLVVGLTLAFGELLRFKDDSNWGAGLWVTLGITWVFWAVLLFVYTRQLQRYQAIFRLAQLVFAGSIAEMLAAVPSHLIVSRRPGCLVGLATAIGIAGGLLVMLWSFGPAIVLLFLQAGRRREQPAEEPAVDGAADHAPFQFRLRTIFLVMSITGAISGVLRAYWGLWPAAALLAWVALLLLVPLLIANPWIMVSAWVCTLAGVVWTFRGEWQTLVVFVLPISLGALVFLKVFARRRPR
jgi:hypothetical protein